MELARKFNTLYLHVGLSKTGTTSIQRVLLDNAALLESQHGIHYPRGFPENPPFRGNHSRFVRALFCAHPEAQRRLPTIGIHSNAELQNYTGTCLQQLAAGFAATTAQDLLISAESVCNFKDVDARALAEWCRGIAESVKVIACVRHPEHALASEIQQRLRVGARLENLYQAPPFKRLRALFEMFEANFGGENIICYSFHRALENPRGLTSEFLRQLGIDSATDFSEQKAENSSISAEAAQLLDALNQAVPQFIAGQANPERQRYSIQPLLSVPGGKYTVPQAVRERVRSASGPEVAWIEEHYQLDLSFPPPAAEAPAGGNFSPQALQAIATGLARKR